MSNHLYAFTDEDLDALSNATGLSPVEVIANETIGKEYIECLRMQHAMGKNGPLSIECRIDMLRRLGFVAPSRPQSSQEIDWRKVRRGVRVIVTPDAKNPKKKHIGTFEYWDDGLCVVTLDGSLSGPDLLTKDQVSIMPEGYVAAERPTPMEQAEPSANGQAHDTEIDELDDPAPDKVFPEITKQVDRADPEGRSKAPVMEKDWFDCDVGQAVGFEDGGRVRYAEFVDIGPADGHVTIAVQEILLDGDNVPVLGKDKKPIMRLANKVVPEASVTLDAPAKPEPKRLPQKPKAAKRKKAASK